MVRLGAKRRGNRVSLTGMGKAFLPSPKHSDRPSNERIPTFFVFSRRIRSSLFWEVTQRRLVVSYRRFGTTGRCRPQGSSSPNLRLPTVCTPPDESEPFVELISHHHPNAESDDERKLYLSWPKRLHSVVLLSRTICGVSDRFFSVISSSFIGKYFFLKRPDRP
jgi:hypothetical protein